MSNPISPNVSKPSHPAATERNALTAAKGGSITFAGALFAYGVRFVIGIILAQLLGPEQFGLYRLAFTAAVFASGLSLLGIPAALVRYVALFNGRRDDDSLWGVIQIGLGLTTVTSLILSAGLYFGAAFIAERLFHEPRLIPLLRLISIGVPFLTLIDTVSAATRGFKVMEYTVIGHDIIQPLLKLIFIGVLAVAGLNAGEALTAQILAMAGASLALVFLLNRLIKLRRPLRTAQRRFREVVKFSLPLYASYLINTFRGNIQTVLLGTFSTVTNVGIFSVATQVDIISQMFHGSITTASQPMVSELYDRREHGQMAHFYQTMTKWTLSLNLPLFLMVFLFPKALLSVFGQDFTGGATALTILALGSLINAGTGICGIYVDMTGNTQLSFFNSVVRSVLTIGLNALLIPRWGITGAAIGALVSESTNNFLRLIEVFVLFRMLPYNRTFVKPFIAGLGTLAITVAVRRAFHTDAHLLGAFANIVLLFVVYVALILIMGLSQEDRIVLGSLKKRIATTYRRFR
jgi:O-antigen/teichoic acid export membrane protein